MGLNSAGLARPRDGTGRCQAGEDGRGSGNVILQQYWNQRIEKQPASAGNKHQGVLITSNLSRHPSRPGASIIMAVP